jgi:protocatechuate 3,4-dioxygenase beta subunit
VVVILKDRNGMVVATTLTDSKGDYVFYDLPAGKYTITETNLAGVPLDVKDSDGGNPNVISVTLVGGKNSTGNDFVDEKCRKIAGKVLEDVDNNDTGDAPISQVTVELRVVYDNGTSIFYGNTTTDSNGMFDFQCVPPGKYMLVEYNPDGYKDVTDSDKNEPNIISVDVTTTDTPNEFFVDRRVTAAPSSTPSMAPSVSESPTESGVGSISGNVSEDINNDDIGEVDLSGVVVILKDRNGVVVGTTLTDSKGDYVFYDLPAGKYTVTETNLAGVPLDVKDVDGGNPNVISITLGGGENSTGNDFIDEKCRKVTGMVMEDVDNNDTGDKGIPQVTVELRAVFANGTVVSYMNTTTDSNGMFDFHCVPPGKYVLVEYNPSGLVDVKDSDGNNPNEINVDVTGGDSPTNEFVDERSVGSISGNVK